MADNTRKTSNVIHEVDDLKDQVEQIQEKIDSIDVGDAYISTINNTKPDESGNIGIVDAGNVDVGTSGNNITLSVDLSDLAEKGDIPTVNDGRINLQASNGVKLAADSQNATANQSGVSTFKVEADLDYLNTNLEIPESNPANDGQINMTGGTGIDVTGQNATANQANNTAWNVSIDDTVALKSDIPTPVVPGDGSITLNSGDGVKVTGNNATANQTNNTAWTVKTDNAYLNANLNFATPDQIPTQYVKDIQSGNLLTLTVDEEDGVYTLTAAGGGGGGSPDITFAEGKCISIDADTVGNLTTYTINCDIACLETNLDFVKPDELPDVPTKTSDLTNDGEDGLNPFITAADIPAIPAGTLPISSVDGTVILADDGAGSLIVTTGSTMNFEVDQNGHVVINPGDSSTPSLPRANTMLEVVSDSDSPFGLILDCTKAAGVYEGRSGIRQYGTATNFEYCIDDTNQAYMFSGGSNARSSILYGDVNADIYVKPNEYVRLQPQVRVNEITTRDAADGDGTIELSGQTVSIKSNSLERVRVDENGLVGVCSTDKGMGTINSGLKIGTDKSIGSQIIVYGEVASSYGQFVGVNLDMETATEFVAYQSSQCVNYAGDDAKVASYKDFKTANHDDHVTAQYGFYSDVANRQDADGNDLVRYQFYAATSAESYFGGMIRARDVKGYADNDAHLILRQQAYIYAEYGTPFVVESDKDASFINYKNGNGFSYFAGIGTTREFEISADSASPTFARFRLSTDCTLTAGDGTPWGCPSDDSIMTRRETEKFVNGVSGLLPITDADNTVKIWSAANDYINFDTGGTNDFKMDPEGNFTANGKFISKSVGITDIAFSNSDNDGFAFITKDYPGIVSNGEQVQNYNYQALPENPSGQTYQRYQSTVKARKGATSYSELMFLSDSPTNQGLRFLSCGLEVQDVLGWPENCGYDSSGVSAILYAGYEFLEGSRSGEYSPLIIGSTNNADVCFIQNTFPFITLDASENDIAFHVPVESIEIKNELKTDIITSQAGAVDDAILEISNRFVFKKGLVSKFEVCGANNAVRLLEPGTEANPCLAFNYSDIGFYFAPDDSNDFTTAESGIAFTISHPNSGVVARERIRFSRGGDILTADDYDPTHDQSVATKKYVDDHAGSGGASSLAELTDVDITDPLNNQVLTYDEDSLTWVNKNPRQGGAIDGGQVPGSGSTYVWHDTYYPVLQSIDGLQQPGRLSRPYEMFACDGVFSDGAYWTTDGTTWNVDPNAVITTSQSGDYYLGKIQADTSGYRGFQGRVVAGNGWYWVGMNFSQDMKQWSSESIGVSNFQPMNLQQYPVWLSNQNYIGVYEGGSWQNYNINDLSSIMPEAGSPTYWFSATQKAGLENAWVCEGNIYCVDFDAASLSDDATANQALLASGITKIATDTVTAGCFSERLQKWFFAAGDKVLVSNTDSLKGGFTEKVFPSNVPFDRCFDDGQSVVFALTGSGNSVTNFSVDGEDWQISVVFQNRDYNNICGTNGRGIASNKWDTGVTGFIPDPADPDGEGVLPTVHNYWRYAVSGIPDPNPSEASTRNIKLTHPVSIASARAIEAQTQEDANAVFTEEIMKRSPVVTLTQAEYDAIPADDIDDNTLYLIT